jgi:hypothetical protein
VTPEERHALSLASLDLDAATLSADSPDRPKIDAMRKATTIEAAARMSDGLLAPLLLHVMREATGVLARVAALTDPDGSLSGVFVKRSELTAKARDVRSAQSDRHAARAQELRRAEPKLTPATIGLRIAREQGRPDRPYDARVVARWLARELKNPTG